MSLNQGHATRRPDLWAALQRFAASPGSHAVAQREPRLLFDQALAVLTLASGNRTDSEGPTAPETVQQGARLFVRHALLRASNDHYALLGVRPGVDDLTLRSHYRALIRLTHPDVGHEAGTWPPETAARVNRAYEVLSTPELREQYDANRQRSAAQPAPGAQLASAPTVTERQWSRLHFAGASAGIVLAAFGALAWLGQPPADPSLALSVPPQPAYPLAPPAEGRLAPVGPDPSGGESTALLPGRAPPRPATDRPAERLWAGQIAAATPEVAAANLHMTAAPSPVQARASRPSSPDSPAPPSPSAGAVLTAINGTPQRGSADAPGGAGIRLALTEALTDTPLATPDSSGHSTETGHTAHTMARLQPLLADLLQTLESGQTERVQQWAARRTRDEAASSRFASAYRSALNGGVVTSLGPTRFQLQRTREGEVVHGAVQLRVQDERQQARWASLGLRAHFVAHNDGWLLARLDAE